MAPRFIAQPQLHLPDARTPTVTQRAVPNVDMLQILRRDAELQRERRRVGGAGVERAGQDRREEVPEVPWVVEVEAQRAQRRARRELELDSRGERGDVRFV